MTRARDLADGADKDITGTLTLDDIVLSNDMSVADDGKVQFGAGNDLQIYHDGLQSYITDTGTGSLRVRAEDFILQNADGSNPFLYADAPNGAVLLYNNGNQKFQTTSTGVDVTGTVTTDGLISDSITNESSNLAIASTQSVTIKFDSDNNQTNREFNLQRNASTGILKAEESGDITFFADDGTTQALRWDASTQRLGLGTTSPSQLIDATATGSTTSVILAQNTTSNDGAAHLRAKNPQNELIIGTDNHSGGLTGTANASFLYTGSTTPIVIMPNGSEKVRITSAGHVGIGTGSPAATLTVSHASGTDGRGIRLVNSSNNQTYETRIGTQGIENTSYSIKDMTAGAVRFSIGSNGAVTMPNQPAFLATIATQADVTGDGTSYDVTGSFFTEVYDKNSDFNNGTFTAPVTGTYHFCFVMTLTGIDSSNHTSGGHTFIASNRSIAFYNNPTADRSSALGGNTFVFSTYIDMDANDTAFFRVGVSGGSKVVDLFSTSTMSGVLVS